MFSFLLLWTLCNTPQTMDQVDTSLARDSIFINGSCWDIATGIDLKVQVTALVDGKKWNAGESNGNGIFDLAIPADASGLIFESRGYRTVSTPIHMLGESKNKERFKIGMTMIALDSQQIVSPYKPEMKEMDTAVNSGRAAQTHFEVRDAYMKKLLTAKICLTFVKSGQTYCLNTDTASAPMVSFIGELDNVDLTVTSDGFDSYQGNLKRDPGRKGDLVYQIKLLKNIGPVLALTLNAPDSLNVEYLITDKYSSRTHLPFAKGKPWTDIMLKNVNLGQHVLKAVLAGSKDVLQEENFTVMPGLNFRAIQVDSPLPKSDNTVVSVGNHTSNWSADKVVLYFDQSSYALRTKTKLTLDSVSGFLTKMPDWKVQITGHTDNVGKHALNVSLSEYRARVVVNYLRQNGVHSQQINFNWKGPDSPVAVNSDERNKMKNRRVELQVWRD
ncbi:OmpA family protein [Dyadobacter sp. LHD-138]|uniref:OmpA family protein n=1 Tax=Dyadobacter sp. LHD-138 TaxID=3071413 RepID=UPI0027DF0D3F|nr:OmpA family protein [Dyadobacter sp. LHD-138]MDQ6477967.1 OmpA family protein [Dyadobacter sp. LHD-138]